MGGVTEKGGSDWDTGKPPRPIITCDTVARGGAGSPKIVAPHARCAGWNVLACSNSDLAMSWNYVRYTIPPITADEVKSCRGRRRLRSGEVFSFFLFWYLSARLDIKISELLGIKMPSSSRKAWLCRHGFLLFWKVFLTSSISADEDKEEGLLRLSHLSVRLIIAGTDRRSGLKVT